MIKHVLIILIVSFFIQHSISRAESMELDKATFINIYHSLLNSTTKKRAQFYSKNMLSSAVGRIGSRKSDEAILSTAKSVRYLTNHFDDVKSIISVNFEIKDTKPALSVEYTSYQNVHITKEYIFVRELEKWVISELNTRLH